MFFRRYISKEIENIQKRLNQLECRHDIENLIITWAYLGYDGKIWWKKYCHVCGKTIEWYDSEIKGLQAKNQLMRQLIKINEKKIAG